MWDAGREPGTKPLCDELMGLVDLLSGVNSIFSRKFSKFLSS